MVSIHHTSLSRAESRSLGFAPSADEDLIRQLAEAFGMDEDGLLQVARKVLPQIQELVTQRRDTFRLLAALDDEPVDEVHRGAEQVRHRRRDVPGSTKATGIDVRHFWGSRAGAGPLYACCSPSATRSRQLRDQGRNATRAIHCLRHIDRGSRGSGSPAAQRCRRMLIHRALGCS